MTVKEFQNLLHDNNIIEINPGYSEEEPYFRYTEKGIELIQQKYPHYPLDWPNAGNYETFRGKMINTESNLKNRKQWDWYTEKETKEMEFIIRI